jgi:hypothetical protein
LAGAPWAIPLKHDWPGWWAKLEAFRLRGPVLYLDLDSVVVGDLTPLLNTARRTHFVALADFDARSGRRLASGVLAWSGRMRWLYEAFARAPEAHMKANATRRHWGDQGFLDRRIRKLTLWQDILPGALVSWKLDMKGRGPAPSDARIVCFHGQPRPWEINHGL